MNKLVSIISPCYNGENYVGRFLESILNQTYDNIEFIIINDGSTDKTEDIIQSYKVKFERRGYTFIYIYQENAGQSSAINKALPIFTGDYMTWPDSDDALPPYSIENRVRFFESHPECGMVISRTENVMEKTFEHIGYSERKKPDTNDSLFLDLITGRNVYYSPGGYMVRSSMFRDAMPKPLQIQSPREIGQNCQLLLPTAFKYPCGYIDSVDYIYTYRSDSHSHIRHSFEYQINAIDIGQEVLRNIVNGLDTTEQQKIDIERALLTHKYRNILNAMYSYHRKDYIKETKIQMKDLGLCDKGVRIRIACIQYPVFKFVYHCYHRLKAIACKIWGGIKSVLPFVIFCIGQLLPIID